jgi:asparagine synthase (glutamine-hydrolysing)
VLPGFDASPNIDALQQIQYSKYMPMRDRTLFSSVWSVPPGVSIAINVRGEIVGRHHAAVPPLEIQEESLEYFETLIADSFLQSVGDRLRPFRRVGVALSGGVDSIAVAFACRKHLGEIAPLHTFTAGKDADDPEVRTAALVSQRLKAEHHLVAMSPESIIEGYPHTLWFLEAPIARTETVQFYEIGRRARGLVDVIFTGAAADALYVGMPNYKLLQLYRWLPPLRYAIHEFHSLTQTGFWPRSFLGRMLTLAYFRGGLSPAPRISNSGFSPELTKLPSVTRDFISNFLHTEFQEDSAQWLPKIERTLAASGLDFASPFLDPRSIRVAFSIPERFKLHGWKEKYVLRRALRDIVDDDLTDFSKFPMQMSIDAAFVDALDVLVDEYLSHERVRARGFFDPAVIAKIKQYRRGKHCYSEGAMRAWTAVGTEIWAEQFIDRRGEPDFDILDRDLKVQSNQIDASSLPIESAPIESVVDIGAHRLKTNSSGDATGHR